MVNAQAPSLVGFCPEDAEQAAAALGLRIVWLDAAPPRWLSPYHEPRVGRQRVCEDGALELLRVLVPQVGGRDRVEQDKRDAEEREKGNGNV